MHAIINKCIVAHILQNLSHYCVHIRYTCVWLYRSKSPNVHLPKIWQLFLAHLIFNVFVEGLLQIWPVFSLCCGTVFAFACLRWTSVLLCNLLQLAAVCFQISILNHPGGPEPHNFFYNFIILLLCYISQST